MSFIKLGSGCRPCEGAILIGKGRPIVKGGLSSVSCAITAEPIEMPFGTLSEVGQRKNVIDGGPDPPCARAILKG